MKKRIIILSAQTIKTDGSLWVWGLNQRGQLGTGNPASSNKPIMIMLDTSLAYIAE